MDYDCNCSTKGRGGGGGFIKGKLRSIYRPSSNKVKPSLSRSPSPSPSLAATDQGAHVTTMMNQDHLPKTGGGDSYNAARMDALPGGLRVDETVDHEAAKYISSVLERFRLEYVN